MRRFALALCCAALLPILAPHPVRAATLRSLVTLSGPKVRLSDLFDDAGAKADLVLGPGPAPGARIVVPARQLAAIARQFGVDWRPASAGDQVVIERPGEMLSRKSILRAVRTALEAAGAAQDTEIELAAYEPPLVPAGLAPTPVVTQLDFDAASGRFTASLGVAAEGEAPQRFRLSGRVVEVVELPVPTHRLLPGSVIAAGDLHMARVRASLVHGEVARDTGQATGMELHGVGLPGLPLRLSDLVRPAAVRKGARVILLLDSPGLSVTGVGEALQAGALGERIQVRNPASGAVLEGEVTGAESVRVEPGSLPSVPPRRGARVAAR